MSTDIVKKELTDTQMVTVLENSLYPGANPTSIGLVMHYCQAAGLDPMQKPVHIVPMWDRNSGGMKDVIMPGIGLYRVQAARSGQYAGMTEPEFGDEIKETVGGQGIAYPKWCKVTVKRRMVDGSIAEFTALEFWKENYAVKGGKDKSIAPNAMWTKRPYGQLSKCTQAQALRMAFPEMTGSAPTADEMEGHELREEIIDVGGSSTIRTPEPAKDAEPIKRGHDNGIEPVSSNAANGPATIDNETGEIAEGPPLSPGMVKTLRKTMERTGKTDADFSSAYGCTVESAPLSRINEFLAWAAKE